jgi:hypothetical protein
MKFCLPRNLAGHRCHQMMPIALLGGVESTDIRSAKAHPELLRGFPTSVKHLTGL